MIKSILKLFDNNLYFENQQVGSARNGNKKIIKYIEYCENFCSYIINEL
jgi:hypothetical protein